MYQPPTLPPTGGGLIAGGIGLAAGYVLGNWLIISASVIVIGLVIFRFWRLRHGEKKLSR